MPAEVGLSQFKAIIVGRPIPRTAERPNDFVAAVLPEFELARWRHHLFQNQRAPLIKWAVLFEPNTAVVSVPFHPAR